MQVRGMKESSVRFDKSKSTAIDWGRLHARLDSARQIIDRGANASPEEKRIILRERAKALARVPERLDMAREWIDVVEFRLADETYAIEAAFVVEVFPLVDLTPLPGTPPFVSGIVTVRGRILSVVDIKKLFDLPEKGLTDLHQVIIVRGEDMELGILADEVTGMRSIFQDEIGPPLPTLTGIRAEYLRGVTKEALIILNAAKMLSDTGIVACGDEESQAVPIERRRVT
jgi:purine-binding chemotaxis protein CheW